MRSVALCALLAAGCATAPHPQSHRLVFESHFQEVDGCRYPWQLLLPPAHATAPAPLVVFLHGAGERGSDNSRQLTWLPLQMASEGNRAALPCFLLAVQCPEGEKWVDVPWGDEQPSPLPAQPSRALRAVMAALDEVVQRPDVDRSRVYLTGLSMGGYGAWDLAMRQPERFAALAPVCGGGDPTQAARLRGLPIWIWHGDKDGAVPVVRSRQMHAALTAAGIDARYSELAGVGHDSWRQAYGEGGALRWMFEQRR